jgi:hypothetical protein
LESYRKISLSDYALYVKQQLAAQEKANRILLLKAVKQAHLPFHGRPIVSEPVIMDYPVQGFFRLRDFEQFVSARHTVGVFMVDDERDVLTQLTEQMKEKVKVPVVLTEIYTNLSSSQTPNGVQIVDPVVIQNSPHAEGLQFLVSSGLPQPPIISFSVECTFKPSEDLYPTLTWLKSDENGKKLIDPKSGVIFPRLRPFWERIADMGVDNATLFLQERIEATTRGTLTLFGVSVDRDLILVAGPAALLALMLFFWLHLRHVNVSASWVEHEIESARDYPWVACFQDRLSGAITYIWLIVLPIGSALLLLINHGALSEATTQWGAGLTLLLIVAGIFAALAVRRFRKHICARN